VNLKYKAKFSANGFTLLELIVVVAIIGLLVSLVGPRLTGQISKGEVQAAKAQIDSLVKVLEAYRVDLGHYPKATIGLEALWNKPADNNAKWRGPYLQKALPLDPWGNPYLYELIDNDRNFSVRSLGRDGKIGGSGDDADLSN
jgi:general secretion pathway protein G